MVEIFKKLKKRAVFFAWIYAALLGVSAALFVFGGLFTLFKLTEVAFPWYGYLLVCLGVAILVGGTLLFFTYPTTKRFAKQLDRKHALNERVQTMVEFSAQSGELLDVQREDAKEALSSLQPKKKGFSWIIKWFLMPVLAISLFTGSIFVPRKVTPPTPPPPSEEELPFEAKPFAEEDLVALIKNVEASNLTENLKPAFLATLNDILDRLRANESTVREMRTAVSESMYLVMSLTQKDNTYNAYVTALKDNQDLAALSKALEESGKIYKTLNGMNILSYAKVENREEELLAGIQTKLSAYTDSISTAVSTLDQAGYVAYVNDYVGKLGGLLAQGSVVDLGAEEGLKAAFSSLQADMQKTVTDLDNGLFLDGAKENMDKALKLFIVNGNGTQGASITLCQQAYSYMIKDHVLYVLSNVFGVEIPKEEGENLGGDDDKESEGGGGGGGLIFADDGLVLDPADGQYKPYGELLNAYYKRIMDLIAEDEASEEPKISEELKAYIKDYFASLQTKKD